MDFVLAQNSIASTNVCFNDVNNFMKHLSNELKKTYLTGISYFGININVSTFYIQLSSP